MTQDDKLNLAWLTERSAEIAGTPRIAVWYKQSKDLDGDYNDQWCVFIYAKNEFDILYMSSSRVSPEDCLGELRNSQKTYVEQLAQDVQKAKEAYEQAQQQ